MAIVSDNSQTPCFTWDIMVNLHHFNFLYIDIVLGFVIFNLN